MLEALVGWHACTVQYAVRDNGHSQASLTSVVREVEEITGLDFTRVPWKQADLRVTITNKYRSDNRLGYTASRWTDEQIISARIVIYRTRAGALRRNVYRHELGHALGLKHVKGSDVMNKSMNSERTLAGWMARLDKTYEHCDLLGGGK